MIKIVADNYVKPDELAHFMALAEEMAAETRKEAGCISYHLHRDLSDELHLTFIEEWEDAASIERHNGSEHFTSLVPQMAACCLKPGTCIRYVEIA